MNPYRLPQTVIPSRYDVRLEPDFDTARFAGEVRIMLANGLQGVCCQQLVPTISGSRTVACEVLMPTPAVRNLIREGKTHQIYSVMQTGSSHGMQTMDYSLAELVRAGRITSNVAFDRCHSPEELKRILGPAGTAPRPGNGGARPQVKVIQ